MEVTDVLEPPLVDRLRAVNWLRASLIDATLARWRRAVNPAPELLVPLISDDSICRSASAK
jgi:hypothetical protein